MASRKIQAPLYNHLVGKFSANVRLDVFSVASPENLQKSRLISLLGHWTKKPVFYAILVISSIFCMNSMGTNLQENLWGATNDSS